ncbi:MAG: NAD-dependent epimerase/dehydratase family protein [Burkholderiales bacterium]|nr:NAD-dependent epimerase/dehydratase family protein [Burkholderiales bacterium]
MTLLVTGANGFVGTALCRLAQARGLDVRAAVRMTCDLPVPQVAVGDINAKTDWRSALVGCDTVIHLAALAHRPQGTDANAHAALHATNVDGALHLARQAADAGISRFVFLSSIKAWGETTKPGQHAGEGDACQPQDAYGRSKHAAEQALRGLAIERGMALVIVRAPLVYGPEAKANFAALVRAVCAGWPLPLGAVRNARSLVGLDNLCDFLLCCAQHPAAAGQTFHVSDGVDLSSAELVRAIARAYGKPIRLLALPPWLLRSCAGLLGQGATAQRLLDNFQLDISKARSLLGWEPLVPLDEGLRRALARQGTR